MASIPEQPSQTERVKSWIWRNPLARKLYIFVIDYQVGRKIDKESVPDIQKFKYRIANSESEAERLAISRDLEDYRRDRMIQSILKLPLESQLWIMDAFNQDATTLQESFLRTGNDVDRRRAIMYRRNALALQEIISTANSTQIIQE